jgi:hypothetical protein
MSFTTFFTKSVTIIAFKTFRKIFSNILVETLTSHFPKRLGTKVNHINIFYVNLLTLFCKLDYFINANNICFIIIKRYILCVSKTMPKSIMRSTFPLLRSYSSSTIVVFVTDCNLYPSLILLGRTWSLPLEWSPVSLS